jgi:hypothetical protein
MKCDTCKHLKKASLAEAYCVDGYWSIPKYKMCDLKHWPIDFLKTLEYDFENCKHYKNIEGN